MKAIDIALFILILLKVPSASFPLSWQNNISKRFIAEAKKTKTGTNYPLPFGKRPLSLSKLTNVYCKYNCLSS
jgi:hypothetical protein